MSWKNPPSANEYHDDRGHSTRAFLKNLGNTVNDSFSPTNMLLFVLSLILLTLQGGALAQRYDPLFTVSDCGAVGDYVQECGEGFFVNFKKPDDEYRDDLMRKWPMIGWVDSAIDSFGSTNSLGGECLNASLVTGFIKICQSIQPGGPWGFVGCAHIPCYGGNATVHLAGCLQGIYLPVPEYSAFNVKALNATPDILSCSSNNNT